MHIKYGYRLDDDVFVVKIATGFYENPKRGLSSSSGLQLVCSAKTGFSQALLLDEGYLTDLRTAAAGAVAAKYLAPKTLRAIGIVGSGIQAHLQLDLLRHVTGCRRAVIWARDPAKARSFKVDGFSIEVADSVAALCSQCNLVVTTTHREPLVSAGATRHPYHSGRAGQPRQAGTRGVAVAKAAVLAVDSRAQCFDHGDSVRAELENSATEPLRGIGRDHRRHCARPRERETNLDRGSDWTLVQDIQIAKLALRSLETK
jgi:ornithine cyclodeaminase